jgi:hypothetical protein
LAGEGEGEGVSILYIKYTLPCILDLFTYLSWDHDGL